MVGQTISHYRILEKLGGGGMGVVYKAEDTKLKRTVALKFLPPELTTDPEAKERFIHEAQAASSLQHNNICNVHDIDETTDGQLFIVMDCYEGETLKSRIAKGKLQIEEATEIAIQIAQGLSKAHESGIIHRDIKPANIIVTKDGVAKIVDFGLAKLTGQTVLTITGHTVGTVAYMSPEQARGEQVDHRTDIWSLGVVLYEMLAGKRPFGSAYEQALVYSILNENPEPLKQLRPDIPDALEQICLRAMEKETTDRYQTAAELINDLESFRAGTGLSQRTRKSTDKKIKLMFAAAVFVVAATVTIFIYTRVGGRVFDSICVLPFENISSDTTSYFSQNLTDEVIGKLWQIQSLRVPSLKTVMATVKPGMTYDQIARELQVKAILEARVQQVGSLVKISARLMDPAEDRPLWQQSFEREYSGVLMLQSELAHEIVRNVRVKTSEEEQDRLNRLQKKVDPRAYELYVESRRDLSKLDVNAARMQYDSSVAKLRRAIAIEPDNGSYYAALAVRYSDGIELSIVKNSDVMENSKATAAMALKLDPDLADGRMAAALAAYHQLDFGAALSHSARALELSPGNSGAYSFRGFALMALGRFDEALEMFRRSIEVDPVAGRQVGFNIGMCYYFMHRYDDAIAYLTQWLPQDPTSNLGHTFLAFAYSMKGMHTEALAQNDSAPYWGKFNRPFILYRAGQDEFASKAFKETLPFQNDYGKATWFALTGQKDSAFYWLERFRLEPSGEIAFIRNDPWLDDLRDDPLFNVILKKMNLLD